MEKAKPTSSRNQQHEERKSARPAKKSVDAAAAQAVSNPETEAHLAAALMEIKKLKNDVALKAKAQQLAEIESQ